MSERVRAILGMSYGYTPNDYLEFTWSLLSHFLSANVVT